MNQITFTLLGWTSVLGFWALSMCVPPNAINLMSYSGALCTGSCLLFLESRWFKDELT
jgi:hypothetical protein